MGGVEKHRFVSYLLDVQLGEEDVSKCGCTGALASVCKGKEFIGELPGHCDGTSRAPQGEHEQQRARQPARAHRPGILRPGRG